MPSAEKYAFEPFGTLAGVLAGQPFRIFPEGTFYRGNRKLTITPERLQEFAANVKAGLPRFRIPINLEHNPDLGKHGEIAEVEYQAKGADGPGLYATKYDLTDAGRKWLAEGKADAVSGEAIWTLNGDSKYQDPTTGKLHDNVLAGVALTATPFFGNEVNLFSATENFEQPRDEQGRWASDGSGGGSGDGGDGGVTGTNAEGGDVASQVNALTAKQLSLRSALTKASTPAERKKIKAEIETVKSQRETLLRKSYPTSGKELAMAFAVLDSEFFSDVPAKRHNGYTKLRELMQQKFNELMALVQDADGDGEPDAMHMASQVVEKFCDMAYPMPAGYSGHRLLDALEIISAMEDARDDSGSADDLADAKRAIKAALSKVTALYTAQIAQGVETMDEKNKAAPEQMTATVSADEFAAYKAQTEAALAAAKKETETFAVKLAEERRTRRLGEITVRVEKFAYVTGDKLAEHLLALEEKAPDQATFFTALLETIDTQAATSDLFKQAGSARKDTPVESLAELAGKIVVEKFDGDMTKYSVALELAGKQRPDLMRAYLTDAPVARGEE